MKNKRIVTLDIDKIAAMAASKALEGLKRTCPQVFGDQDLAELIGIVRRDFLDNSDDEISTMVGKAYGEFLAEVGSLQIAATEAFMQAMKDGADDDQ